MVVYPPLSTIQAIKVRVCHDTFRDNNTPKLLTGFGRQNPLLNTNRNVEYNEQLGVPRLGSFPMSPILGAFCGLESRSRRCTTAFFVTVWGYFRLGGLP